MASWIMRCNIAYTLHTPNPIHSYTQPHTDRWSQRGRKEKRPFCLFFFILGRHWGGMTPRFQWNVHLTGMNHPPTHSRLDSPFQNNIDKQQTAASTKYRHHFQLSFGFDAKQPKNPRQFHYPTMPCTTAHNSTGAQLLSPWRSKP